MIEPLASAINLQAVTTPDGIIELFHGGFPGTVNDSPAFLTCQWTEELMGLDLFNEMRPCIDGDHHLVHVQEQNIEYKALKITRLS